MVLRKKSQAVFAGIMVAVITAVGAKGAIDNLYSIGVQQGYAPKQPIAYSHKVHAGDYAIDCNYCHNQEGPQGTWHYLYLYRPQGRARISTGQEVRKDGMAWFGHP